MIQFLLNRTPVGESELDANTTVLQFLRRQRGHTGTKEGCAGGDCGACTVVLAEEQAGRLRYRSINACITLVSALHGKQLFTVEDLQHKGELHAVQQAMVANHASQCGFCTPGIVMSLFALQQSGATTDRHGIEQALGGNLCRCTGYRAIIDAASQCCRDGAKDDSAAGTEKETLARLASMRGAERVGSRAQGHEVRVPTTLKALSDALLTQPEARLLAGGTDLALSITLNHLPLPQLIDISHIPELKTLQEVKDSLEIGAAATLSDCEPFFRQHLPIVSEVLGRFASRQIRNQATLGGNLANASPIGDGAPLLLALNARLRLRQGEACRELPLDQFFLSYRQTALRAGEFIESIIIPKVMPSQIVHAWKVSKRREDDISAVFGAFSLDIRAGIIHEARLAYGGMAAIPQRASRAEATLTGSVWDSAALARATEALAADFTPLSDLRASSGYRLRVAQNLLKRFWLAQTHPLTTLEISRYV